MTCRRAPASGCGGHWPRSTRYRKRHNESPRYIDQCGPSRVAAGAAGHDRSPPSPCRRPSSKRKPRLSLGMLPLARRDVERFRQILGLQRRLLDPRLSPRARRALMHRGPFREALAWLEIHGEAPEAVEHWRGFIEASGVAERDREGAEDLPPHRRRRRRRRRSFRPATD